MLETEQKHEGDLLVRGELSLRCWWGRWLEQTLWTGEREIQESATERRSLDLWAQIDHRGEERGMRRESGNLGAGPG